MSLSHFNFRNNILTVLVPRMNSKALAGEVHNSITCTLCVLLMISLSLQVSRQCCEVVETLFDNDIVGEVSLEVN